ncbi:hypothetical protein [Dyadobacter pollutisoli]|uniref:Uncharacterized protein n=1 Tax=Dyadobacter pollutisoli TaxID=2910158 RepID=A0A9E8SME7_9BACT|nr:hypothetical protein [Dyadobacter pollutisoli]WAC13244.1 hypothetical protein ON006_04625 [Dyadobacter pollutisoli]
MNITKSDLTQSQREETCHLIKETVRDFAAHHIKPISMVGQKTALSQGSLSQAW